MTTRDAPAFGYRPTDATTRATAERPVPEAVADVVAGGDAIDLSRWAPEAHYQGSLGSCTSHAGCAAVEGLMAMADRDGLWGGKLFRLARLATYQQTLANSGHRGRDMGASGIAMLRVLARSLPDDAAWPYSEVLGNDLPPPEAWTVRRLINHWPVAHRASALRAALAMGCPFVVGIPVYSGDNGMASRRAFETGEVREPEPGDELTGWHMVSGWSHDPATGLVKIQNHWRGWGDERGMGTIPAAYLFGRANEIHALGAVR